MGEQQQVNCSDGQPRRGHVVFETTAAEREIADVFPLELEPAHARRVVASVPFWFHTFCLNRKEGIYTPGYARDHRYHLLLLPADFSGLSVLDVGAFDGFYAFLAEARGARRVLACDNEQYVDWVRSRWGVELEGGEGIHAIRNAIGSSVEYALMDAFDLSQLEDGFDVILCLGTLHRVVNPLGMLMILRQRLADCGELLLETYGVEGDADGRPPVIRVQEGGEAYPGDDFVYWGFSGAAVERMARIAGFAQARILGRPTVDGHPRILAALPTGPPDRKLDPTSSLAPARGRA